MIGNFVKSKSVEPKPPPVLVLQVEVVTEESSLPETIDTSTATSAIPTTAESTFSFAENKTSKVY